MWWEPLFAEAAAEEHLLFAAGGGSMEEVDAAIKSATDGCPRAARIGLVGSVSYTFPGIAFKDEGVEATRRLTQSAASAVAERKAFSTLVIGGTMAGPQGDWASILGSAGITVIHVLPEDGQPRDRGGADWRVVMVGEGFSERNMILASLAGQYAVIGGGPGTLLEVTELRARGTVTAPSLHHHCAITGPSLHHPVPSRGGIAACARHGRLSGRGQV